MASPARAIVHLPLGQANATQYQTVYQATVTHRGIAPLLLGLRQGYCQALFEELASRSPDELVDIVRESRAPSSRLTYAAEILGRDVPTEQSVATLAKILRDHPSPLVREGAILGLSHHLDREAVRDALRRAASQDPSPGVKRAASEALED